MHLLNRAVPLRTERSVQDLRPATHAMHRVAHSSKGLFMFGPRALRRREANANSRRCSVTTRLADQSFVMVTFSAVLRRWCPIVSTDRNRDLSTDSPRSQSAEPR